MTSAYEDAWCVSRGFATANNATVLSRTLLLDLGDVDAVKSDAGLADVLALTFAHEVWVDDGGAGHINHAVELIH